MAKIKTHAVRALDEIGVPYEVLRHPHKARNVEEAAAQRDVPVRQVVKTLLTRRPDKRHVIAVVRGDQRLSLKKLARVVGIKSLEMAPEADVPRITGYRIGGISPFGTRRKLPTVIEESLLALDRIVVNGGRRGVLVELATDDLVRILDATPANICH